MLRSAPLLLLALPVALALAACDHIGDANNATEISIQSEDSDGNTMISSKGGAVSIKAPGFEGSLKIPGIQIQGDDLDVNGVKLPPKSRIVSIHANGSDNDKDGQGRIRFETDMAPDATRDWFKGQFARHGFKADASGTGFSGTTDDNQPFTLDLSARGSGTAGIFDVKGHTEQH